MHRWTKFILLIMAWPVVAAPAGATTMIAQTDFGTLEGTNIAPFASGYDAGFSFPPAPGQYDVSTNATGHGRPPWGGGDHTTGTGCFMLVDGATNSGRSVVTYSVAALAGWVYTFEGWVQNVFSNGTNPTVLRCRVNGIEIGTHTVTGAQAWQLFTFRYTNDTADTKVFELQNINTAIAGNDFGLDDLALYGEPVEASAGFALVSTSNGYPAITITNAVASRTTRVERSSSLLDTGWAEASVLMTTDTNWTDTSAGSSWSSLYYRISQDAPENPWYMSIPRTNLVFGRRTNDVALNNIRVALSNEQPGVGMLWLCAIPINGAGAAPSSDWLNTNGTWDYTRKPRVPGSIMWTSQFSMVIMDNTQRGITGNGLPSTPTGIFPIPSNSLAFRYDRNTNTIQTQNVSLEFAAIPAYFASPFCVPFGANGIALSGSAIYHGASTLGTDASAFEMLDDCGGHTDGTGTYHYHMLTDCMLERYDNNPTGHSALIGYMMDGFGLFGPRGDDGEIMTTNQLDECHGHTHEVDWDGQRMTIYHYHWTFDFPYNVGCMRGAPVPAWNGGGPSSSAHVHPHE